MIKRSLDVQRVITRAFLVVLTLLILPMVAGCSDDHGVSTRKLPRDLDSFTLTEMWNAIVEVTDIQETSAELTLLGCRINEDGTVGSVYLNFQGRNKEGKPCLYFGSFGWNGRVTIHRYETDTVRKYRHPVTIFEEIDKVGLDSLELGSGGLYVQIDFTWGGIGYHNTNLDIYQVEAGELQPIEELVFHTDYPVCHVSIGQLTAPTTSVSGTVSTSITAGGGSTGDRTSQIWFLTKDVERADTLKYLE